MNMRIMDFKGIKGI